MRKLRVLVAEDHTIVRKGLRSLLDDQPGVEITGEAQDGKEAVTKTQQLSPDLVLMDIAMPGLNGLEATRQIKRRCPHTEVVILSMHANDECICEALRAGASGYVVKEAAVTELASAIQAISRGDSFFSPSIYRKVIEEQIRQAQATRDTDSYDRLSDRQKQVLRLIVDGFSNKRIAQALQISVKTVETHRALLMDRLGLHGVPEMVKYAIRKGIARLDQGWRKAPEGRTTM